MGYQRIASWAGVLAGICVVLGTLAALVWSKVVPLPVYTVNADFSATITEAGQTQVVSADAWFVVLGLTVGLAIGWLSWSWFKAIGWPTAFIAAGAGLLSGLVCWGAGEMLGPGPFDARLAVAQAGDRVPIALQLHAPSALAVWVFAAVAPTLFGSSLGPELRPTQELRAGPRARAERARARALAAEADLFADQAVD